MFNNVMEQFQTASKPFADLFTLSAETTGQMLRKQGEFVSEVFADSCEFTKEVLSQRDVSSVAELQKQYLESMQEKATANGQFVYNELTEVQEKSAELMKEMFSRVGEAATQATEKPSEQ